MNLKKINIQQIEGIRPWFQNVNCFVRIPTIMTYVLMGFQIVALIFYILSPFILFLLIVSNAARQGRNSGEVILSAICLGVPGAIIYFILTYKKIGLSIVKSWRKTRRFARNPQPTFSDSRRPVLLLRSFLSDLEDNLKRTDQRTPEEFLVESLNTIGPVITAGQPGEEGLPLLGATRIYLDQDWDKNILELIKVSNIVVIDAGNTTSLAWEMECVRHLVNPRRVLISLLTKQDSVDHKTEILEPKRSFELFYKSFSNTFQQSFGSSLPEFDSDAFLIQFDDNWNPYPIKYLSEKNNSSPTKYVPVETLLLGLTPFVSNLEALNRKEIE